MPIRPCRIIFLVTAVDPLAFVMGCRNVTVRLCCCSETPSETLWGDVFLQGVFVFFAREDP
jgi:hypothetical protein